MSDQGKTLQDQQAKALQQAADAIRPPSNDPVRNMEPVHADEPEVHEQRWTGRLVIFLRVMALLSMAKGLYHWAIVCGISGPPEGFEYQPTPWQTATVFFAVIDLVAAVGLWLAAAWGAVVWLTACVSMAAVEVFFPQVYGGRLIVVGIEGLLLFAYLGLPFSRRASIRIEISKGTDMNRREILKTGLGSLAVASAGWPMIGPARAAEWPTKAVRVVVPYAPGSATDLIPRTVFEQVGQQVGQTFIIENRPGGGTTVGTAQVKNSDPDGYTILIHSNALVTVPAIQASVPYDPVKDFSAVIPLGNVPLVLVVAPSKGMKTLKELVDKAKAKPGEINYAAAGIGTPPHLTMERFRLAAGFEGQLVPFKGSPEALTEVMTGRVDMYFAPISTALPLIKDGKLLALAVSSAKRATALPDVPTTIEGGVPDSDFDFWVGAFMPKNTPREIVAKMHDETVKAINNPSTQDKLKTIGVETMIMTPEAFDARIAKEAVIAKELTKAAKIEPQ